MLQPNALKLVAGLCLLLCCTFAGAAEVSAGLSGPQPAQHHRRGDRFQNNYLEFEPKGLGALLRWRGQAAADRLPKPPRSPTPRMEADLTFVGENAHAGAAMIPAATWIGHASVLVQVGGANFLTDPMFSDRASPLAFIGPKRQAAPGLALADLPHIDAVLISHNHYDHLDVASVHALASQPGGSPLFIVPLGIKRWMEDQGITNVIELDWWESASVSKVEIVLTPSQHWSGRGLNDRMKTLWGGYAMFAPEFKVFFAGDTAYLKDFADIHARFAARHGPGRGFDLALIPIGAYEPRWFMSQQHVDPAEAVQIHLDVAAVRSIGIYWGTFELTDEALDEPPLALASAARERSLSDGAFTVMAVGETRRFPRRFLVGS